MFYLTAHFIRSEGKLYVNGAVHQSLGVQPPTSLPKDQVTVGVDVGPAIATVTTADRGGNRVEAFLDVVAPDSATLSTVEAALRAFLSDVPQRTDDERISRIRSFTDHQIACRYWWSAQTKLAPAAAFEQLSATVSALYESGQQQKPAKLLIIEVTHRGESRTFSLADESKARVHQIRPDLALAAVSIRDDVYESYAALRGDFEDELPALLVVESDLLREFDAVEFRRIDASE